MASGLGQVPRQAQSGGSSTPQATLSLWKQRVQEWYPDLYRRAYFIPPVYMHRTQHQEIQLTSGRTVYVTQPPLTNRPRGAAPALVESDVRDDQCQQKVLDCLYRLSQSQGDGLFVLSQLNFRHYLNEPSYAAAARGLARPVDLRAANQDRGDFDVLLLHRRHGVLVGEVKAIGDTIASLPQQQRDQLVKKKVEQAIRQLDKARDVLRHLLAYLQPPPRVQTTLMVPNITRAQLQRVLGDNPQLIQDLRSCLGMAGSGDPSRLCMTSDDVKSPAQWWQQRVTGGAPDPAMTDPVYLDLVSRFCGPATTVTVQCSSTPRLAQAQSSDLRTPGDGVGETAARFAPVDIVLHPAQVAVLNRQQPLVYLNGPPGTGKTLLLLLKALDWLEQNKPVQLVSVGGSKSLAASCMLEGQLQQTAGPAARQLIHLHTFDFNKGDEEVERAVETLRKAAVGGQLYVIVDEADFNHQQFTRLCEELHRHVPSLHLWAASLRHGYRPPLLTEEVLTQPLRTPPSVTRLVQQQSFMGQGGRVHGYTASPSPSPCDGPAPRVVLHTGQGHGAGRLPDCVTCGQELARILLELGVGGTGRATGSPQPLQYRDVFILNLALALKDTVRDASGQVTRPASGLLRGVRGAGIPVTVLQEEDERGLRDVATMAGPDHVIAAEWGEVQGLERKVVVYVGESGASDDLGKLFAASRCTSQLIWISPEPLEQSDTSSDESNDDDSDDNGDQ